MVSDVTAKFLKLILFQLQRGIGAKSPNYFAAGTNTQLVGRQVALLVEKLRVNRKVSPDNVHLLGFSLGAHAVGFAGRWAQETFKYKIGRLTLLDAGEKLQRKKITIKIDSFITSRTIVREISVSR